MANKYRQFDQQLFDWLRKNRENATTAGAVQALNASEDKTLQRHISRRFTQLEDRKVLRCTLKGTTRVCEVIADIPASLAKQRWRPGLQMKTLDAALPPSDVQSIPATTSEEFLRMGGEIERLPNRFDEPRCGSSPVGPSFFDDDID